jgi:hypothetical protein
MSIGKEDMRNGVIENVIRNWATKDPSAAETWVKAGPFSDEQRERLSAVISEMRKLTAEGESGIITE